jgi:phosphatidylglycerophosphate synthase
VVGPLGKRRFSEVFGPFFTRYFLWLLQPIERLGVAWGISPNVLTFLSLVASAGAGLAVGFAHLATAGWLYIVAGGLDVLDGRLARATGKQTRAGAFLDSVSDRWGELFVLSGFLWYLRDSAWMLAVIAAIAGSMMVSYTRARGEGVGIILDGGIMQRAERIALVSVGTLITAWFNAGSATAEYGPHVIGVALMITGVGSTVTALGRWHQGYRMLHDEDEHPQGNGKDTSGVRLRTDEPTAHKAL